MSEIPHSVISTLSEMIHVIAESYQIEQFLQDFGDLSHGIPTPSWLNSDQPENIVHFRESIMRILFIACKAVHKLGEEEKREIIEFICKNVAK